MSNGGSRSDKYRAEVGDWVAPVESMEVSNNDLCDPAGVVVEVTNPTGKEPREYVLHTGERVIASEYGFVPMPWQIELRTKAIRKGWSKAERQKRVVQRSKRLEWPQF